MDNAVDNIEAVLSEDNEDGGGYNGRRMYLKMLVPQKTAGAVIGKGGKAISDMQEESGARIKISQSSDFYPGSSDRTVLISGSLNEVALAQELLWKIIAENRQSKFEDEIPFATVIGKLSIPNECGGLLIGKAGASIRSLQEKSGARVQIASKESNESRLTKERVVTISGSVDSCIHATDLIINKMSEEQDASYQNKTTSCNVFRGAVGGSSRVSLPLGAETVSATSTITMKVPDSLVGNILGKRGATIREIHQMTRARVVVSSRGDGEGNGERNEEGEIIRTVTITGEPSAAQMAQLLISQKLQLARSGDDRR